MAMPVEVFQKIFAAADPFPPETEDDNPGSRISRRAIQRLVGLMVVGVVSILTYALLRSMGGGGIDPRAFATIAGVSVGIASASIMTGGLLGFIFGIPRTLQAQDEAAGEGGARPAGAGGPSYRANTNLEQISDWLTKILVGVGLTQLTVFPERLQALATWVGEAIGPGREHTVFASALMVFYAVGGFLFAYLWTRLYLQGALRIADQAGLAKSVRDVVQQTEEMQTQLADARARAESAQAVALGTGGVVRGRDGDSRRMLEERLRRFALPVEPGADPDDPWKGQFGGSSRAGGLELSAQVAALPGAEDAGGGLEMHDVVLTVRSVDPARVLTNPVQFFLHPTFSRVAPVIHPGVDGTAELKLIAYGAFTVGVLADGGKVRLELDLAGPEVAAPDAFKER